MNDVCDFMVDSIVEDDYITVVNDIQITGIQIRPRKERPEAVGSTRRFDLDGCP